MTHLRKQQLELYVLLLPVFLGVLLFSGITLYTYHLNITLDNNISLEAMYSSLEPSNNVISILISSILLVYTCITSFRVYQLTQLQFISDYTIEEKELPYKSHNEDTSQTHFHLEYNTNKEVQLTLNV